MYAQSHRKNKDLKKHGSNFAFTIITLVHDNPLLPLLVNPSRLLRDAGLRPGQHVVEVGCGPGFYTIPAAEIVGQNGLVYAVDIHPRAIARVKKKVAEKGIKNVLPILANASNIGLADKSVDVAFFFGLPRIVGGLETVLVEMRRILKQEGTLAFKKSRRPEQWMVKKMGKQGMLYSGKQGRIITFQKK